MPEQLTLFPAPEVRLPWSTRYSSILVLTGSLVGFYAIFTLLDAIDHNRASGGLARAIMVVGITAVGMAFKAIHDATYEYYSSLIFDLICFVACLGFILWPAIHSL